MAGIAITPVESEAQLDLLDQALRALSRDLGDAHAATPARLAQALRGPVPAAHARLACTGGRPAGAVLFSPVFSTVEGSAGLYVSDLWVARERRGQGLGRRLLAAAAQHAAQLWQAEYLSLAVYAHSRAARRFYEGLGFVPQETQTLMQIDPPALTRLMKDTG